MALAANAQDWASQRIGIFFPAGESDNSQGYLTGQCVSLIKWFLAEMCEKIPEPFRARGHAKDFGNALVAEGLADQVGDLKRGDIIVWPYDGGGYGHIGVYMGDGTVFEENVAASGQRTANFGAGVVYAADVDPLNAGWRVGGYNIYRVRTYVENIVASRDRSDEINFLNGLYRQILDRNVDEGAITHYLKQIDSGWNWEQIKQDLLASAEGQAVQARRVEEAKAKARELQAAFDSETNEIKRLYKEILERDADEGGIEHYRNQIRNGWNWQMVADDLRNSNEYKELQHSKETPAPETQHVEDRAAVPAPEADLSGASRSAEVEPETRSDALRSTETHVEPAESPSEQPKDEDSTTILKDIRSLLQSLLEAFKGIFKKD